MPGSTTLGGSTPTAGSGWTPWNPGYGTAGTFAAMPQPAAASIAPSPQTPPTTTGQEPAAYEANPYGKIRPKHVGGSLWMGGRIIEGPFFGPTATDPTLTAIYYLAERANPNSDLEITKLAIRGMETAFDGSGNLTDSKFAGATVEFKVGESPQTPCVQSVERYGANAIGYTRGILIAIKNLPLRPLAGIIPLISGYLEDSSFGDPADDVSYNDLLGVILKDARYRPSEYEVDLQRSYPAMVLSSSSSLIGFLQNERKIIVHMDIGFTDKVRIHEPTTLNLDAEVTNSNAVRGSLAFGRIDTTTLVRKIRSKYIDKDRDYQDNIATAQEDVFPYPATDAIQTENVERPVVSTASQETADANVALYERLAVRSQMRAALLTSLFGTEVGDGTRYADHEVIEFAGRVMETQHDYEKWQVQIAAGEVLNCGAESEVSEDWLGFHEASGTNSSYNFGSCDIGDEDAGRLVVVVATSTKSVSPARAFTAVTIGGNAATIHATEDEGDPGLGVNPSMSIAIASLVVPTGATATIAVVLAGNVDGACISVYALYGLTSTTPHDTASGSSNVGGNPSDTIAVQAGGVVIAGYGAMGGTLGSASWIGLSDIDQNESFPGVAAWSSGAHQSGMAANAALPLSVSSSATGPEVLIAASFK